MKARRERRGGGRGRWAFFAKVAVKKRERERMKQKKKIGVGWRGEFFGSGPPLCCTRILAFTRDGMGGFFCRDVEIREGGEGGLVTLSPLRKRGTKKRNRTSLLRFFLCSVFFFAACSSSDRRRGRVKMKKGEGERSFFSLFPWEETEEKRRDGGREEGSKEPATCYPPPPPTPTPTPPTQPTDRKPLQSPPFPLLHLSLLLLPQ